MPDWEGDMDRVDTFLNFLGDHIVATIVFFMILLSLVSLLFYFLIVEIVTDIGGGLETLLPMLL